MAGTHFDCATNPHATDFASEIHIQQMQIDFCWLCLSPDKYWLESIDGICRLSYDLTVLRQY